MNRWLKRSLINPNRTLQPAEEGWSVATALALGIIGTILATSAMYFALSDFSLARHNRDWTIAFQAAEAGMNAYLAKLEDDPQYWALDPSKRDPDYFPGELSWTQVPEGDGEYRLDITPIVQVGKPVHVLVSASGRYNGVVRTMELELERRSFLEWGYFTDFETYTPSSGGQSCLRYNQAPPDCGAITFITQDVLHGPVKSNDWIRYCGSPTFESTVESGYGGLYRPSSGCSSNATPNYLAGPPNECGRSGKPCPSQMPISNSKLLDDAEKGGYVYQGPIEITPLPNGKIRVYSRYGLAGIASGPAQTRTQSSAPPTSTTAEWLPPPNGVIYVKDKPAPQASQARVYIGGRVQGGITIGSAYRVFIWKSLTYADTSPTSKDVIGIIANDAIIIGDDRVRCNDPRKRPRDPEIRAALLSLNGDIRAWAIINPPDNCPDGSDSSSFIHGTINFYGALAQKWRGVVGTYTTNQRGQTVITKGYAKNYNYDSRLLYTQPPRFMEPTNSSWRKITFREVPPKY